MGFCLELVAPAGLIEETTSDRPTGLSVASSGGPLPPVGMIG